MTGAPVGQLSRSRSLRQFGSSTHKGRFWRIGARTATISFQDRSKHCLANLLPSSPKAAARSDTFIVSSLAEVPEVQLFEAATYRRFTEKDIAYQIAKVNFLNARKPDHFVESLRVNREDLSGLRSSWATLAGGKRKAGTGSAPQSIRSAVR